MYGYRHLLVIALFSATCIPGSALAGSVLYGTNFSGPTALFDINQSTGVATGIVGDLENIGDLTSNQVDTLWGVTLSGGNNLVSIDPLSGNVLSSTALTGVNAGAGGGLITSLAYNPLTGKLYGNTSTGFGDTVRDDDLYEIDPGTGALTYIGPIDFQNVYALAFDQLGVLFGITDGGALISIDSGTGAGDLIADGLGFGLYDLASRPEDNTMFVTVGFSNLGTIDTLSGVITPVGSYVNASNMAGLAFLGAAVPEPMTSALCAVGLLVWRLRRQGTTAVRTA